MFAYPQHPVLALLDAVPQLHELRLARSQLSRFFMAQLCKGLPQALQLQVCTCLTQCAAGTTAMHVYAAGTLALCNRDAR